MCVCVEQKSNEVIVKLVSRTVFFCLYLQHVLVVEVGSFGGSELVIMLVFKLICLFGKRVSMQPIFPTARNYLVTSCMIEMNYFIKHFFSLAGEITCIA